MNESFFILGQEMGDMSDLRSLGLVCEQINHE